MTTGKCNYGIIMKHRCEILKILIKYTAQKGARVRSYSGPHLPGFGMNTDRCGMSEYRHFSRSDKKHN